MLGELAKNRTTEKDIRNWLNANGFHGNSAVITDVELHAVQRPGWLQVFRFQAKVKSRDENLPEPWRNIHGVVRDDERLRGGAQTEVKIFDDEESQQLQLKNWSVDLIECQKPSGQQLAFLISAGVILLCLAIGVAKLLE